jgi:hypothetical protein
LGEIVGTSKRNYGPRRDLLGNMMGTFLDVDMSFMATKKMSVAQILVFLNIRKGLAEEIIMSWRGKSLA